MTEHEILQYSTCDSSGSVIRAYVSYGIMSDALDSDLLTAEIGIEPTRSWTKGNLYVGKQLDVESGRMQEIERIRPYSLWELSSEEKVESSYIEDHASILVKILDPQYARLEKYINNEALCRVKFHIWWEITAEHGGFKLTSKTLSGMAKLCQYIDSSLLFITPEDILGAT